MSTFLLEMALDEARVRERLSKRLLAERERRGGGNARRFPQPRMAELLGVTLRTYQGWEAGVRVPAWRNLEEIAERLDTTLGDLMGTSNEQPPEMREPTPVVALDEARLRRLVREEVEGALGQVEDLLARLLDRGRPESPADGRGG